MNQIFLNIMNENVSHSLELMWKGMLGIFAVLTLIAIIIFIIGKFDKPKTK